MPAKVMSERKCIATVNVWGYPLKFAPDVHTFHGASNDARCSYERVGCLHHVPIYAELETDTPEPTDAVKDAIALTGVEVAMWAATIETHALAWAGTDEERQSAITFSRRVIATLAAANKRNEVLTLHYSSLEAQNFDLTHALEAANKRAEDADKTLLFAVQELEPYSLPLHPSMSLEEKIRYRVDQVHFAIKHDRTRIANLRAVESAAEDVLGWLDRFIKAYGRVGSMLEKAMEELRAALTKAKGADQ